MSTTAVDERPELEQSTLATPVTALALDLQPKPTPARFALDTNDFWTHVLLVAIGSAVVVARAADGKRVNVVIYACGAAIVLGVATVAHLRHRTTAERPVRTSMPEAVRQWAVRRAVPAALVAAPLVALLLGLLGVVGEPVYGYAYLAAAFVLLPAFVAWRTAWPVDEDEPVRMLHRYALYAAIPYVVFTVVRLPAFYVWDFVYWGPWFVFGGAPIGETATTTSALVAGACLYSLQGWALSMGYYVLFRRRSLLNALLYLFVFVSSLYSFVFPVLLMTGWHPHWRFHVLNFWAHFWMAVAAWAVPLLFTKVWPRLRASRIPIVAAIIAVWLTPYAFAFGHAAGWQADRQRDIERRAFDAVDLTLSAPVREHADGYDVQLELGPRQYTSFARATRLVEVEVLDIDARLSGHGTSTAFCRPLTRMLPSPWTERVPARYDAAVKRLDTTAIVVRCARTASGSVPTDAEVEWAAELRLRGEREARVVSLTGRQRASLEPGS